MRRNIGSIISIPFFRILIILLLLSFTPLYSQHVEHQSLYWLRYFSQITFSPAIQWNNEIDNRRFLNPDVENQLIINSHLHYSWKKWDVGGGLSFSWIFALRPELQYDFAIAEVRPFAEVSNEQQVGKITFQNRIRFDNRFIQSDPEISVWEESFYLLRIRYRAQMNIPLKKNAEQEPKISLRLSDEIMFNTKENTFDQNRVDVTLDFYLNKNFSIEPGYVYLYQHRLRIEEYFSRHVIRFSVIHRISLY
jgi:Protein of unknown function (DUF2490)